MATLKLAKKEESSLCPVHELHSVKGEYHLDRPCVEGVCMFLTRERMTRDAFVAISKAAADAYESILVCGDSDEATFLGRTTAMVLAIEGLALAALKRIDG